MLTPLYYAAGSLWAHASARYPLGRNIFDAEWDVCVVLDSTRVSALRDCWPATDTERFGTAWSVGSISTEWMAGTFRPAYRDAIEQTALVTANPHSKTVFRDGCILTNQQSIGVPYPSARCVDRDTFAGFHELWRSHATAHDAVPARVMADATIEASERYERVVAHWLQPHEPFLAADAELVGGSATSRNVWDGVMAGNLDADAVIQSYRANLRDALDELQRVLQAIDGRVLVTADHGNAFGEWAGIWGHPFGWPQPAVRKVPWVVVEGDGRGGVEYESRLDADAETANANEQLEALGYH